MKGMPKHKEEVLEIPKEFEDLIKVLEFGFKKGYNPNGWLDKCPKKGRIEKDKNADSMFHHLCDLRQGIWQDHESGLHPALHLAVRALMHYTRWKRGLKL